jgi:hypothetical protein
MGYGMNDGTMGGQMSNENWDWMMNNPMNDWMDNGFGNWMNTGGQGNFRFGSSQNGNGYSLQSADVNSDADTTANINFTSLPLCK